MSRWGGMSTCKICGRIMSEPDDPLSENLGGDCLLCMATIAEDPFAIKKLDALRKKLKGRREVVKCVPCANRPVLSWDENAPYDRQIRRKAISLTAKIYPDIWGKDWDLVFELFTME